MIKENQKVNWWKISSTWWENKNKNQERLINEKPSNPVETEEEKPKICLTF